MKHTCQVLQNTSGQLVTATVAQLVVVGFIAHPSTLRQQLFDLLQTRSEQFPRFTLTRDLNAIAITGRDKSKAPLLSKPLDVSLLTSLPRLRLRRRVSPTRLRCLLPARFAVLSAKIPPRERRADIRCFSSATFSNKPRRPSVLCNKLSSPPLVLGRWQHGRGHNRRRCSAPHSVTVNHITIRPGNPSATHRRNARTYV